MLNTIRAIGENWLFTNAIKDFIQMPFEDTIFTESTKLITLHF